jgi:hypothetical protein
MALPGFTAEASVGPTTQVYRMQHGYGTGAADVSPQSNGEGFGEYEGLGDEGLGDEGLGDEGLGDEGLGDEGFGDEDLGNEGLEEEEVSGDDETGIEGYMADVE